MLNDVKRFFYNYLNLVVGRALFFGLAQLGTLLLLVRIFSPTEYGNYVLFIAGASIMMLLVTWTSAGVVRFGREEFIQEGHVRKTLWANIWILVPCFIVTCLLIFVLSDKIAEFIKLPEFAILPMYLYILAATMSFLIPVFFQAMGRMGLFSYLPLIASGGIFVVVGFVYVLGYEITMGWLIVCLIACHTCCSVAGLWLLRHQIMKPCFPVQHIKRLFVYLWPLIFAGFAQNGIRYVDQIVIRLFMVSAFVGIYNVAYQLYDYAVMLPVLSISLTFPMMVTLVVNNDRQRIQQYINRHASQVAFAWCLVMSALVLLSWEVVYLFGHAYVDAAIPLGILLTSASLRIFLIIESPVLTSHGLIKQSVAVSLGIGAVNLGLDFLLIPVMGITGAAVATTVAFIVGAVVHSWIIKRSFGLNDYKNYRWAFPVLLALGGLLMFDALVWRVMFFAGVVLVSLFIAKKAGIYDKETWLMIEEVDMPDFLMRLIRPVYKLLVRT